MPGYSFGAVSARDSERLLAMSATGIYAVWVIFSLLFGATRAIKTTLGERHLALSPGLTTRIQHTGLSVGGWMRMPWPTWVAPSGIRSCACLHLKLTHCYLQIPLTAE